MTSWPLTHQTEQSLEPMDRRTSFISSGQLITVTAHHSTLFVGLFMKNEKWYVLKLKFFESRACHFRSAPLTVTTSPSFGITASWLGKYSVLTAAWMACSVTP